MSGTEYVCGFMLCPADRTIALVRKNKPAWQAGRLNGIGGKVEAGENRYTAMAREWREETSDVEDTWAHFATLEFPECKVHFFSAKVESMPAFNATNDIGEAIEVHKYEDAVRSDEVIENLRWLMPLAFDDPEAKFVLCAKRAAA